MILNLFSLCSAAAKAGAGAWGQVERGTGPTWLGRKKSLEERGAGSQTPDAEWGPENPSLGASLYPQRQRLGTFMSFFLIGKRAGDGEQQRKHGPAPSQPRWSPTWRWGGGPAGTCWSFLLASSPWCANPRFTFCPSRWGLWETLLVEGLCQLGLIKCEVLWIMKSLLGKRIR